MSDEMDEIWELYADDGTQALDATEAALEAVMAGAGDTAPHVAALFRAVHTFKGNSRVLGLSVVESRAHLAEDLIGLVRDGGVPLTAEIVDCLMETADILRRMLDETVRTRADVLPDPSEGLMAKLRALIARHGGAGAEAVDTVATPAAEPVPEQASLPEPAADIDADPEPAQQAEAAEPAFETRRKSKPRAKSAAKPADAVAVPAQDAAPAASTGDQSGPSAAALSLDAGYRTIFLDMVAATLADLSALQGGDLSAAAGKADGLSYAAGQLGLAEWAGRLAVFLSGPATPETLAALIADLAALRARDFGTGDAAPTDAAPSAPDAAEHSAAATPTDERNILVEMEPILARIADLGLQAAGDTPPTPQTYAALAADIDALVQPEGLVRLSLAGHAFADAHDPEQFRRAQLAFFEELSALEAVLSDAVLDAVATRPSAILRSWAADNIFATLQDLRLGLDDRTRDGARWFAGFEPLMRRAFHACGHFHMETAAQLTMALVDLFARSRAEGRVPDVILIQMARGFIDTMELVFDTLDQGDTPDIARIEQLFDEAATVSFVASGVVTARVIEDRLGLPVEFHRVLSPESVKAAQSAIDAGFRFYVIRSDLNGDDALAERFLQWLTTPPVRMITNATVFKGDVTLFDFLVAAPLPEDRVVEALVQLDPGGARLDLREALQLTEATGTAAAAAEPSQTVAPQEALGLSGVDSLKFLETIGEISAGQSMIAAMLDRVSTEDMSRDLDMALRQAGMAQPDPGLRGILRDLFEQHMARLRQINEAQAQLSSQLVALQEQSVALRSRPADVLLKPLQAFVATRARELGHGAKLSIAGGEVQLDQGAIEQIRGILKRLLSLRLAADPAPRRLHLAVSRAEDQMRIELFDDGDPQAGAAEIDTIAQDLQRQRASLRRVLPPDGGLRLYLSVPLQMIALEGMVVRVGEVHYVLPIEAIQRIHQGNDSLAVSAADRRRMLRLTDSELVPVRSLPRVGGAAAAEGLYVIVHNAEQMRMAIPVDELLGQQLVLLRPLEGVLGRLRDMSGVAILSGGEVGMVVSVSRLAAAA